MPGGGGFVDDLRAMIDAGRAFGRHPLWLRIAEGRLPRSALGPFAVQFFLQVREFPRAVSALHSSCPDIGERIELAESLYEEETGPAPAATSRTPSSSSASERASAFHGTRW